MNKKIILSILLIFNPIKSAEDSKINEERLRTRERELGCLFTHIPFYKVVEDIAKTPFDEFLWYRKFNTLPNVSNRQNQLAYLKCFENLRDKSRELISKEEINERITYNLPIGHLPRLRHLPHEKVDREQLFFKCSKSKNNNKAKCALMVRIPQEGDNLRAEDLKPMKNYITSAVTDKSEIAKELFQSMEYVYNLQNRK